MGIKHWIGSLAFALTILLSQITLASQPNIIFILADDLGYGDLGCYGQTRIATPRLDRMAAEGMRFTDFYAGNAVCAPSRCVLMTGLHTGHAHVRGNANGLLLVDRQSIPTTEPILCHRVA